SRSRSARAAAARCRASRRSVPGRSCRRVRSTPTPECVPRRTFSSARKRAGSRSATTCRSTRRCRRPERMVLQTRSGVMKAYQVVQGSKSIEGLKRVELPKPEPGPGQVLVRMRAASLNFRDLAVVNGKYIRGPLERDTIPLSDGAGEVEAVGEGVAEFKPGDRVLATFTQGDPP